MYWLCFHFFAVPLEVYRQRGLNTPFAVMEAGRIVAADEAARADGIRPGLKLETALGLVPTLEVRPRDGSREEAYLHERADRAFAFTSMVSLSGTALLLEIAGSVRLFGGRQRLVEQARAVLAAGTDYRWAGAPTALGAMCLARGGREGCADDDFRQRFAQLPITVLPISGEIAQRLRDLGLKRVSDCLRLPRSGLRQRFGDLPGLFDRAHDLLPDPQPRYEPTPGFTERLNLPLPAKTFLEVMPAIERLLQRLEVVLVRRAAAVDHLDLQLFYRRSAPTHLCLRLARPQSCAKRLAELWRERLRVQQLPEAVEAVVLSHAGPFLVVGSSSGVLFRDVQGAPTGVLLDRLRARLPVGTVRGLAAVAEYRPERAWHDAMPGASSSAVASSATRPLWLLKIPERLPLRAGRPYHRGRRLHLSQGPERIETGWWDGGGVERDYFIAKDPEGARVWIFRDRRSGQWFLQGLFA